VPLCAHSLLSISVQIEGIKETKYTYNSIPNMESSQTKGLENSEGKTKSHTTESDLGRKNVISIKGKLQENLVLKRWKI